MKNNILNILRKEIREMFRDKKSLAMMLVTPVMIPLLVIGLSALFDMQVNKPIDEYNKIGFSYEMSEVEKNIAKEVGIDVIVDTEENLIDKYNNGNIDLYVLKDDNKYTINGEDNDTTAYASALTDSYFKIYKEYLQSKYLVNNEVDANEVINIISVDTNIIVEENFFADYIVNYALLFIIMAITVSATYPATDTTAGEKERGTLETLLTFPIKSKDIIIGKFLSVSLSSIITGVVSLMLTLISLLIANDMFDIYKDVNLMLSFSGVISTLIAIVAYSFLISGLCIAIAGRCKTFKEAQSSLTPLTFISFFPGFIAFMVDLSSNSILSLVPFLNISLLFIDIVSGTINILNMLFVLLSTVVITAIVLFIIIRQYKSEKILFSK